MRVRMWVEGMRPRTLPASVAPVIAGVSAAWMLLSKPSQTLCDIQGQKIPCAIPWHEIPGAMTRVQFIALLCLVVAVCMQIAVNFANDYSDGIRGSDRDRGGAERQSGKPTRLVASGVPPRQVLLAAACSAAIACICGIVVAVSVHQYWLIVVGAVALLAGWLYTGGKHPYGYSGWGELSAAVFFGPVATLGTQYAVYHSLDDFNGPGSQAASYVSPISAGIGDIIAQGMNGIDLLGILLSMCVGINTAIIMLVNNVRDIEDDIPSGKRTLAVRLGRKNAELIMEAGAVLEVSLSVAVLSLVLRSHILPQVQVWAVVMLWIAHFLMLIMVLKAVLLEDYRKALSLAGMNSLFAVMYVVVGSLW